jgi:hypothetical protein
MDLAINSNSTGRTAPAAFRGGGSRRNAPEGPVLDALIAVRHAAGKLTHLNRHLGHAGAISLEDLAEQALYIDEAAMPSLDTLWRHCVDTGDEAALDRHASNAVRFAAVLAELYTSCIRQLVRGVPAPGVRRTLLFVRAMHAIRVLCNWHWLRYETPPGRYWNAAAFIDECAERESRGRLMQRLYRHAPILASVSSEYYALRFVRWADPRTLSAAALDALACAGSGQSAGARHDEQTHALAGWIMQLQGRVAAWQCAPAGRHETLPDTRLPAKPLPGFRLAADDLESVRRAGWFLVPTSGNAVTRQHADARPCQIQCAGRDGLRDGLRVFVRGAAARTLRIGALAAVGLAPSKPPAFGVIRALVCDGGGNWEIDIETLADDGKACSAVATATGSHPPC